MNQNIFYVVGEKFKKFSANKNVMTISELEQLTDIYRIGAQPSCAFLIGQGVNADKLTAIIDKINKNGLAKYFSIKNTEVLNNKDNQKLVHKAKLENVMISMPQMCTKNTYVSQLTLQDNCAEMDDHTTGHHIQGMVLIEAARQMMLSVTENFILDEEKKDKYYFVLNSVNTTFYQFIFPVQVSVLCLVYDLEITNKGSVKAKMKFSFMQNNNKATDVEINFSAFEKSFLEKKEKSLAENAVATSLKFDAITIAKIKKFSNIIPERKAAIND